MSTLPPVKRTYSRRPAAPAPSSSLPSLPSLAHSASSSSSPRPSSLLFTPPPSSPPRLADFLPSSPSLPAPAHASSTEPAAGPSSPRPRPLARVDANRPLARPVQSSLEGFFAPAHAKRKRARSTDPAPGPARAAAADDGRAAPAKRLPGLTQLHLTHRPLLHTCAECHMSFVRGGADDGVHEQHHARAVRGVPWDARRAKGARVLGDVDVGKGRGQIVVVEASSKVDDILATVDTVLASPPLPPAIRAHCKVFLITTAAPPPAKTSKRPRTSGARPAERVVAVVVAQPIKWAMRVLDAGENVEGAVDSGDGVFCDPTPLPTPLGIHRLFTVPAYRALGLAQALLDAAARHTVYGCAFDPARGQAAFSQPTESGRRAMARWTRGAGRVFVDDESQV